MLRGIGDLRRFAIAAQARKRGWCTLTTGAGACAIWWSMPATGFRVVECQALPPCTPERLATYQDIERSAFPWAKAEGRQKNV